MRALIAGFAAWLVSAAAFAQDVPDVVMEAYVAYEEAVQAGDVPTARAAAERAFAAAQAARAADPASIDAATTAILAENAAQLALSESDFAQAASRYEAAGELLIAAGDWVTGATKLRNAGEAAVLNDRSNDARRFVRRAIDALEGAEETEAYWAELSQSRGFEARLLFSRGLLRRAGLAGAQSVDAALQIGQLEELHVGLGAFYAGAREAFSGDPVEAAYYMTLADRIVAAVTGEGDMLRPTLGRWSQYLRNELDEAQAAEVLSRLAAAPAPPAQPLETDITQQLLADPTFVDAVPLRQPGPSYPREALRGQIGDVVGIEGVALVSYTVTETGETADIEVIASIPISAFGEAGARAVRGWRFEPATRDGAPVERPGQIQFEFILEDR